MKKKILSLTLAVLMIVSLFVFTSCEKETPYSLVSGAVLKTSALDSMDIDMTMNMSMTMDMSSFMVDDVTMEIPMTIDMQASNLKSEAPKVYTEMTTESSGIEMTVKIYQDGEYFYIAMPILGNIKTKAGDFTADYDSISDVKSMMKTLPKEIFTEEIVIVKNEDGTKTVALDIPNEKFDEIYKELVDDAIASIAEGMEITDLALTNAKVEITVNEDGYVATYKIAFDMEMTLDMTMLGLGVMNVTATVDSVITYNNPGEAVTVTPMENLDSFEELTEEDLESFGI